jgi:hypothetical protein
MFWNILCVILVLGLLTSIVSVSSIGVDVIEFVINANCPQIDNKKKRENEGDFHINLNHKFIIETYLKMSYDQSR